MSDVMTFPKTVEEFMENYKVVDTEWIYMSKGAELVPIFRMRQWFGHLPPADVATVRHGRWEWIGGRSWRCSECEWIHEPNKPRFHYCPNCGARMDDKQDV